MDLGTTLVARIMRTGMIAALAIMVAVITAPMTWTLVIPIVLGIMTTERIGLMGSIVNPTAMKGEVNVIHVGMSGGRIGMTGMDTILGTISVGRRVRHPK